MRYMQEKWEEEEEAVKKMKSSENPKTFFFHLNMLAFKLLYSGIPVCHAIGAGPDEKGKDGIIFIWSHS